MVRIAFLLAAFAATSIGAGYDIVEEILLRLDILFVLDGRSEPMLVKFPKQSCNRSSFHLLLVERLDRGEAGGGAGSRTGGSLHDFPA